MIEFGIKVNDDIKQAFNKDEKVQGHYGEDGAVKKKLSKNIYNIKTRVDRELA